MGHITVTTRSGPGDGPLFPGETNNYTGVFQQLLGSPRGGPLMGGPRPIGAPPGFHRAGNPNMPQHGPGSDPFGRPPGRPPGQSLSPLEYVSFSQRPNYC